MQIRTLCRPRVAIVGAALLTASAALAHIRIYPTESTNGTREKYTMRVPNEKQVKCVRIEASSQRK